MVTTLFALALVVGFITPGFIYRKFVRRFLTVDHEDNVQETFLAYGITGMMVLILTWPLFSLFGFDPFATLLASNDVAAFVKVIHANPVAVILQLIVSPVILAIFSAYIQRKSWDAKILEKMKLVPLPRHPTALTQAVFYHRQSDPIVEVVRKDGTKVYGMLGPQSCVTARRGHPDIFLESVYDEYTDGDLIFDEMCTGILILGSEISMMKFYMNPDIVPPELLEDDELGDGEVAESVQHQLQAPGSNKVTEANLDKATEALAGEWNMHGADARRMASLVLSTIDEGDNQP